MKNIIKHNLKQKIWLTGCVTLLFVLCRPMMQLMTYENEKRYAITKEALISVMERFFLPNVFTDYVPTAIACVVIGIVFFSYLFSKKRVDLYHSIPVDRRHLFVANYISGVVVYLIALFAEFIICTFVAIPNHYMTLVSVENMIAALFINFVHFMFGYGVVITAIMLSGNAVVALALSAVIALIYPVVVSLIRYFEGYFYVTYNNCDIVKQNLLTKYYWLSPITSYATIIQRVNYEWELFYYEKVSMAYAALILPLIMTIVFTAIAYLLYMKRPSEAAGRAIAFKNTRAYIEIPFVITCGLTGGWFMSTSMNTYKPSWIWIGVLLGAILSHCVLEAILNESFKSILSHKIQFVVSIAVVVIIMGIFYTDATKYDYYVPNKDSVASANVYFCDIDSNLSSIEFIEDEKNPGYYVPEYKDRQDTLFTQRFTDGVMIEKIIGISNIGVSCVPEMIDRKQSNEDEAYYGKYDYATEEVVVGDNSEGKYSGISEEEAYTQAIIWMEESGITEQELTTDKNTITVKVCYELKNGKIVLRKYEIPVSRIVDAMNEVYKTEEYKKVHFSIYKGVEENKIFKVEVYDSFENRIVALTENEKDKFLQTYMDELSNINIDTISQVPVGRINPLVKVSEVYNESYSGYYIYPEFKKTLALIESYGADISGFTADIKAEDIMSINISSYDLYKSEEMGSLYVDDLIYDRENDGAFISEIAEDFVNANNAWSNSALIAYKTNYMHYGVDTFVNLNPVKGIQRGVSILYKDGKVPEKIKKDIIIKMWENNN